MLRFVIKIALIGAGILGVILGAHGLYIYFSRVEFIFSGKDPTDLFMAIGVPTWFGGMVEWATIKGLQSWFIPGCLVAGGIFLWYLQSNVPAYFSGIPRPITESWRGLWHRNRPYDQHPLSRHKVKDRANFRKKAVKALLCITAIAIFIFLVWSAFFVFQRKEHPIWGLNSIAGAVAILVSLVILILNIRALRSYRYRWTPPSFKLVLATLLVIFLVCAFAGVQPLSNYKDDAISGVKDAFRGQSAPSSVPRHTVIVGNWQYTLERASWKGSELTVKLTIINIGRNPDYFGCPYVGTGGEIVAIDLYKQIVETDFPCGDFYNEQYYPQQSRTGTLKFTMNPNCVRTDLYMKRWTATTYYLFDCGSPQ